MSRVRVRACLVCFGQGRQTPFRGLNLPLERLLHSLIPLDGVVPLAAGDLPQPLDATAEPDLGLFLLSPSCLDGCEPVMGYVSLQLRLREQGFRGLQLVAVSVPSETRRA